VGIAKIINGWVREFVRKTPHLFFARGSRRFTFTRASLRLMAMLCHPLNPFFLVSLLSVPSRDTVLVIDAAMKCLFYVDRRAAAE
jgi:hypothetical protein